MADCISFAGGYSFTFWVVECSDGAARNGFCLSRKEQSETALPRGSHSTQLRSLR